MKRGGNSKVKVKRETWNTWDEPDEPQKVAALAPAQPSIIKGIVRNDRAVSTSPTPPPCYTPAPAATPLTLAEEAELRIRQLCELPPRFIPRSEEARDVTAFYKTQLSRRETAGTRNIGRIDDEEDENATEVIELFLEMYRNKVWREAQLDSQDGMSTMHEDDESRGSSHPSTSSSKPIEDGSARPAAVTLSPTPPPPADRIEAADDVTEPASSGCDLRPSMSSSSISAQRTPSSSNSRSAGVCSSSGDSASVPMTPSDETHHHALSKKPSITSRLSRDGARGPSHGISIRGRSLRKQASASASARRSVASAVQHRAATGYGGSPAKPFSVADAIDAHRTSTSTSSSGPIYLPASNKADRVAPVAEDDVLPSEPLVSAESRMHSASRARTASAMPMPAEHKSRTASRANPLDLLEDDEEGGSRFVRSAVMAPHVSAARKSARDTSLLANTSDAARPEARPEVQAERSIASSETARLKRSGQKDQDEAIIARFQPVQPAVSEEVTWRQRTPLDSVRPHRTTSRNIMDDPIEEAEEALTRALALLDGLEAAHSADSTGHLHTKLDTALEDLGDVEDGWDTRGDKVPRWLSTAEQAGPLPPVSLAGYESANASADGDISDISGLLESYPEPAPARKKGPKLGTITFDHICHDGRPSHYVAAHLRGPAEVAGPSPSAASTPSSLPPAPSASSSAISRAAPLDFLTASALPSLQAPIQPTPAKGVAPSDQPTSSPASARPPLPASAPVPVPGPTPSPSIASESVILPPRKWKTFESAAAQPDGETEPSKTGAVPSDHLDVAGGIEYEELPGDIAAHETYTKADSSSSSMFMTASPDRKGKNRSRREEPSGTGITNDGEPHRSSKSISRTSSPVSSTSSDESDHKEAQQVIDPGTAFGADKWYKVASAPIPSGGSHARQGTLGARGPMQAGGFRGRGGTAGSGRTWRTFQSNAINGESDESSSPERRRANQHVLSPAKQHDVGWGTTQQTAKAWSETRVRRGQEPAEKKWEGPDHLTSEDAYKDRIGAKQPADQLTQPQEQEEREESPQGLLPHHGSKATPSTLDLFNQYLDEGNATPSNATAEEAGEPLDDLALFDQYLNEADDVEVYID